MSDDGGERYSFGSAGHSSSRGSATDRRDLSDVPLEGKRVFATFDRRSGRSQTSEDVEEVIDAVDFGDDEQESPAGGSPDRSASRRASQEYYDVLEMASRRLRQEDGEGSEQHDEAEMSSGDEAVRKRKKKKKKSKKDSRRKRQKDQTEDSDEDQEEEDGDGRRRSAVFQTLFPPGVMERRSISEKFTSTFSEKDLISPGNNYDTDEENVDMDPNDDLPLSGSPRKWNPAALVTRAQSKMHGKVDKHGFYKDMKGRAGTAYQKVQKIVTKSDDGDIPIDFNLHSLGKSGKEKRLSDSIDWGDDSMTDREVGYSDEVGFKGYKEDVGDGDGIEMVDDCSYADLNEATASYMLSEKRVKKLMWQRDKRRLRIILCVAVVFFSICLGVYLSGRSGEAEIASSPQSSPGNDDSIERNEPPPRPLPPAPTTPTNGFDSTSLHTMTLEDLQYIVNRITPDASILNNPHTPQSKALEWAKNDMTIYNVEVASRVAQRYALATLYYSTNGTGWAANTNWGDGHECEWHGVGCETGESNVVSVTYIDLNSNKLDGSIPPEIGYIASLEQIHLWGNNLVGSIPDTLSQLVSLHTLYLDRNSLDGEMGDTFDRLKNLKHLDLSNNRLRGHIPHGLGSLTKLRDLRLSHNFFTSTFPVSLISLSNLQTLLLDSNSISGTLPSLVGEMRSLVTIRVHENDLKGKLPSFTDAVVLEEAHFDGNYFSGPIPHFGSKRLRELYLGQNALTGGIPDSIGDLVKLEILSLSANSLNSTIPGTISAATALQILDLSHNKLSGELPPGLSDLVQMRELRLDHNRLRGFPGWLGSMKYLEIVHLNNNLLAGEVVLPLDVGDLDDLKELAIETNDLTGVIGEHLCDLLLDVLTSDCYGNPPPVDCPCCTRCF